MVNMGILIASCDKNIWLLNVFFKYFFKFWAECPYKIYVSLEDSKFEFEDKDIIVLNNHENIGWGGRIKRCLESITEKYVLVMLDDFIIEEKVNQEKINQYIKVMNNEKMSNLILTPVLNEKNDIDSKYDNLVHRNRFGRYKTSLQCGIWNRELLCNLLKNDESAWEFEIFGNIRSFLYRNEFYSVQSIKDKPIDYNDGFFMVQGRLNLKEKRRIEEKTGEKINVEDIPSFEECMIRDDIEILPRIFRRLRIIFYYSVVMLKYMFMKEKREKIK